MLGHMMKPVNFVFNFITAMPMPVMKKVEMMPEEDEEEEHENYRPTGTVAKHPPPLKMRRKKKSLQELINSGV